MRVLWFWVEVMFITVGAVIGARLSILHGSQYMGPVAAGVVGALLGGLSAGFILMLGGILRLAFDSLRAYYLQLKYEDRLDARRKQKGNDDDKDYPPIKIQRPRW